MPYAVAIQHALDTGRYHPAFYSEAPLPGGNYSLGRFKSRGHHTEGFETVDEAQRSAASLAAEMPVPVTVPDDGFPVVDLPEAGVHVWIQGADPLAAAR